MNTRSFTTLFFATALTSSAFCTQTALAATFQWLSEPGYALSLTPPHQAATFGSSASGNLSPGSFIGYYAPAPYDDGVTWVHAQTFVQATSSVLSLANVTFWNTFTIAGSDSGWATSLGAQLYGFISGPGFSVSNVKVVAGNYDAYSDTASAVGGLDWTFAAKVPNAPPSSAVSCRNVGGGDLCDSGLGISKKATLANGTYTIMGTSSSVSNITGLTDFGRIVTENDPLYDRQQRGFFATFSSSPNTTHPPVSVPEPASPSLLTVGLAVMGFKRKQSLFRVIYKGILSHYIATRSSGFINDKSAI